MAFFKPNQITPLRPATTFLKSSVSCARRISKNNTRRFPFYKKLGITSGTRLPVDSMPECQEAFSSSLTPFNARRNMTAILDCSPYARVGICTVHFLLSRLDPGCNMQIFSWWVFCISYAYFVLITNGIDV